PQDRSQPGLQVLAVAVRVVCQSAVPQADVEIAVGSKYKRAAVVIPEGLLDAKEDFLALGVCLIRVVRAQLKPRYDRQVWVLGCRSRRVVNIDLAVLLEVGVESQPQKALFILPRLERHHAISNVEK